MRVCFIRFFSLFATIVVISDLSKILTLGQPTTVIALIGDAAPDGNGSFGRGFGNPSLSGCGQVAFAARLTGTSGRSNDDTGVFRGDGVHPLTQIFREDELAPDGNGDFDDLFVDPYINPAGQVAIAGPLHFTTGPSNYGLFFSDGSKPIVQIARELQASPDGNGQFFGSFRAFSFGSTGYIAFRTILTNTVGGDADNSGIFRSDNSGALTTIVRGGDSAPDGNGVFRPIIEDPQVNASGLVAYSAELEGTSSGFNDSVIIVDDGVTSTIIVRNGDSLPGGGNYVGNTCFALSDSGEVAFAALISNLAAGGVFRANGDSPVVEISRGGLASPDGNGIIEGHSKVAINSKGFVVFEASICQDGSCEKAILLGDGVRPLELIVRTGQPTLNGNGVFSGFNTALNDKGQVAFIAMMEGTASPPNDNIGIYFYDKNVGLLKVARKGDFFLGSTITNVYFSSGFDFFQPKIESNGLNNLEQVAFRFKLANGDEGIAIWSFSNSPVVPNISITSFSSNSEANTIAWNVSPLDSVVYFSHFSRRS
ncbi:MAG: hypothetical protein KJT03_12020 [Verrucomicrobiae bacterium]|nr:hypothetical protein [Verrucomicrobiae bacterium]